MYLLIPYQNINYKDCGGNYIGWIDKAKNHSIALALVQHYKKEGIIVLIRKEIKD